MVVLVSFLSLVLGVVALRQMFVWEQSAGSALLPLSFAYFLPQHLAFGFGGFLTAIFGHDLNDITPPAMPFYSHGLVRFELANLVSLYAALAGVGVAVAHLRLMIKQRRGRELSPHRGDVDGILAGPNLVLGSICYASLALHAVLVTLQWSFQYWSVPGAIRYVIDAITRDGAPATFLLWGIWLARTRAGRVLFGAYLITYASLEFATFGRGPVVQAIVLFAVGHLAAPGRRRLRPFQVLVASALAVLFIWFFVVSHAIIETKGYRGARGFSDFVNRAATLVQGWKVLPTGVDAFHYVGTRVGVRLAEPSAVTIFGGTPESVPHAGWTDGDWAMLSTGWLPSFMFPNVPSSDNDGPITLQAYGFYFPPGSAPGGIPVTLLADAWRRFGWAGVIVVHFILAAALSGISILLLRRGTLSARRLLLVSALVTIATGLYPSSLVSLIVSLPRRALIAVVYSVVVSEVARLMRGMYGHYVRRGRSL